MFDLNSIIARVLGRPPKARPLLGPRFSQLSSVLNETQARGRGLRRGISEPEVTDIAQEDADTVLGMDTPLRTEEKAAKALSLAERLPVPKGPTMLDYVSIRDLPDVPEKGSVIVCRRNDRLQIPKIVRSLHSEQGQLLYVRLHPYDRISGNAGDVQVSSLYRGGKSGYGLLLTKDEREKNDELWAGI